MTGCIGTTCNYIYAGACPDGSGNYGALSMTGNSYYVCTYGNQSCGNIFPNFSCVSSGFLLNPDMTCKPEAVCTFFTQVNSCR